MRATACRRARATTSTYSAWRGSTAGAAASSEGTRIRPVPGSLPVHAPGDRQVERELERLALPAPVERAGDALVVAPGELERFLEVAATVATVGLGHHVEAGHPALGVDHQFHHRGLALRVVV